MGLETFLLSIGVNLASNLIWDILKEETSNSQLTQDELNVNLQTRLEDTIQLENSEMISKKIIKFVIEEGALIQNGNYIESNDSIVQKSETGGVIFTKNTTTKTPNTIIKVQGEGASITQAGNAEIIQSDKGISITVRGRKK